MGVSMVFEAEISFLWARRLEILVRSHTSEKVLADRPKNELRTARESEVVADISSSPSRRPWWLCAEVVFRQSDIATFILFYRAGLLLHSIHLRCK